MSEKPQSTTVKQRLPALLIGSLVSTIVFATFVLFQPAGTLLCLLVPFPAILLRFSYGRELGISVVLGAAGLTALLLGNQAAYLYLGLFGVVSMLLPELLARGLGASRSITVTVAMNLTVAAVVAFALAQAAGVNLDQWAVTQINANYAAAVALYERLGFKGDDLAMIKQSLEITRDLFIRIYPAIAAVLLTILSGVNVALAKRFAPRLANPPAIDDLTTFKTPDYLVWLLILSGFSMLPDNPLLNTSALNVLVVVCMAYLFQGVAVVLTLIERSPMTSLLRIMFYILLVLQPYMLVPVTAIGIFDLWGDFRAPRKQENL
ncbi:MAG TPA: YybS family protein [Deltaproteobacteria bacterium]|nr:YybS family protein [Deltaproteobacteria bacterium]HQB38212.1 YybS family protein [Deltaproteobacteria bacterium]